MKPGLSFLSAEFSGASLSDLSKLQEKELELADVSCEKKPGAYPQTFRGQIVCYVDFTSDEAVEKLKTSINNLSAILKNNK